MFSSNELADTATSQGLSPPAYQDVTEDITDPGWSLTTELEQVVDEAPIMGVCTDASRCGCAIYSGSCVKLVADRKDPGDPYKGLDIIIQKISPKAIVVSAVQKRLIVYLEKRFKFDILDLSRGDPRQRDSSSKAATNLAITGPTDGSYKTNSQYQSVFSQAEQTQQQSADVSSNGATIEQPMQIIDLNSDVGESSFTLAIVPNIWFSMRGGFQKLLDSEFVKSKGFRDVEEKSLFITSKVDRSVDVCALRAISALEKYLIHIFKSATDTDLTRAPRNQTQTSGRIIRQFSTQISQLSEVAETIPSAMPILNVGYIDPGPILSMDKLTFQALGIFRRFDEDSHATEDPNIQTISSLYEILNECQSPQGKKQLKSIMLWPLQDMIELRNRLNVVEYFMQPDNRLFRDQLTMQLKSVVPLNAILMKLNSTICTHKEFMTIYKVLWAFLAVIDLTKNKPGHGLEILNRIESLDSQGLRDVVDSIMNIVDFEASRHESRVQVCFGVDENVDEKKEIVKNLAKFCDEVALQETAKYKDVLRAACRVLYVPRIGFLNSIDYTTETELQQIRSNKEFEVLLHTEQSVYFKTSRMEQLDNNAGDIACDLIDVQESVVVDLQNEILKHTETALRLLELCGELDCLIAFSIVSFQRSYVRPEMAPSDEEINIEMAYHPLHCVKLVANDIRFYKSSSERQTKVMVITGPNSCGKTTFMKATCLVVYMAHIGCFVPAASARIPIVDAILTRIHSANSVSTGLSSFANDLHQINYALSRATEKSLIAIDEFGKGTHAQDGFQLLKGLVTYFARRIQESPYVMISTHYSRLADHLQNYSEFILYKTFKISRDNDNIVYDYKIIDGVGEHSLADKVAAQAGIPQSIISRATEIRNCITSGSRIRARPPFAA